MAETKFQCPQCDQKILVDASASGVRIDCPYCCSTLVIPTPGAASVVVEVRRQFAVLGGTQAGLYRIIEEQKQKLQAGSEELAKLRAVAEPAQAELQHLRSDLASAQREREAIAARIAAAEVLREASGAIQVQLAQLREENAGLKAAQDELTARAVRAEESSRGIGERLISNERERSELKAQITLLQTGRIQESAATLQQENGGLRQRLDELLDKLRACEQQLEAALAMGAAIAAERDAVREQAREQKAALEAAVGECASARLETGRLENALATISTAHEKTRRESFAVQQHASLLENGLRVREKELQEARESADLGKSEQTSARERMNALEAELRDLREQLTGAADAEQTYKTLIEDTDRVLNESHAQVKALSVERDRLAAALSRATGGGVSAEFDRLRASHDRLQASVLRSEEQLEQNSDTILMIEAERDRFKAELDLLRSETGRSGVMLAEPA